MLVRQAEISRLTAHQILDLEELDTRQIATADGCRSLSEWTSARFDIGLENARNLVRTMRRTVDRPRLRDALAGELSFDRVEALSRIPEDVGLWEHTDIAGVRREAAQRVQISSETEYRTAADRFLVLQPSLDESWWKLFGGLDGASGAIVDKVLSDIADQLPTLPNGSRGDSAWRRATALVQLAVTDDPPPAQVTVFVDSEHAVETNGQTGVILEAGPRIGRDALEAVLCDSITEVTARGEDGTPMRYGRHKRTIPPALRRAILHRDGNRLQRRRMRQPQPSPNTSHHPLESRRTNRSRQSHHPLLVPPSRGHPRTRLRSLPPSRPRADQVPPTRARPAGLIRRFQLRWPVLNGCRPMDPF